MCLLQKENYCRTFYWLFNKQTTGKHCSREIKLILRFLFRNRFRMNDCFSAHSRNLNKLALALHLSWNTHPFLESLNLRLILNGLCRLKVVFNGYTVFLWTVINWSLDKISKDFSFPSMNILIMIVTQLSLN